jgi:hypothetical protein
MKNLLLTTIALLCFQHALSQAPCKKLIPCYKTMRVSVNELSPLDLWRDSVLRSNNQIALHLRDDINGLYELAINDSVYYRGKISGNPHSGYSKEQFVVPIKKGIDNVLRLKNLETGTEATIKVNAKYLHLILSPYYERCKIGVTSTNRRPFYG